VVIEGWLTSPAMIELLQRVLYTHAFLRMAAIELSRIAERAPDVSLELRHVAQKLEAEAEDLARHYSGDETDYRPSS
jgi:hypothetical protein